MNFESSVPGAYFVGPVTAFCFGPLYRFVCGAAYAAPAVARHLAGPVPRVRSALRRLGIGAPAAGPRLEPVMGRRLPSSSRTSSPCGRYHQRFWTLAMNLYG